MSANTYLTTDELAARIKYDVRTIRERLKDSVLLEGVHYIRPFGGRKILYVWEQIEKDMALESLDAGLVQAATPTRGQSESTRSVMIPMASGVACRVAAIPGSPRKSVQHLRAQTAQKEARHG